MGKTTSVMLGDHLADFVEARVRQGRYLDAGEVVRAGLRLLEEREANLEAIRSALVEGELSGPPTPFDFDAFVARKRAGDLTTG